MNIVGLDLSLTSSGIAVIDSQMAIHTCAHGEKGHGRDSALTRNPKVVRLADIIAGHVPPGSFVVIEGPSYNSVSTSSWDRGGLWHMVVAAVREAGCSVSVTPPANAKMWMAGHPHAGKTLMRACAQEFTATPLESHDEADALTFALMGAHHLGLIHPSETYRDRALVGVEWGEPPAH